jgi:hypothetical protein
MLRATGATVTWDQAGKHWRVRIQVGAEVINRKTGKTRPDAGEEDLKTLAVETAKAEGYDLAPAQVSIGR